MQGMNFTVFDFETTGLDPMKDRVIEMAAIKVKNGEVVSQYETIVSQPIELSGKITEITGITQEMMVRGIDEKIAFNILRNFFDKDTILVAHNALFDLAFLHFGFKRIINKWPGHSFIDTLTISRDRHFYPHKLTDMCDRYGIKLEGAHRSLNDVYGCWELLKAQHEEKDVTEWINKLGYMSKYGVPKWAPDCAELFPTENKYEPRSV